MFKNTKFWMSFLLCFGVSYFGSIVTMPAIKTWYLTIQKPSFNPPNWIFGPVWTLLFSLMTVSLYLIWNDSKHKASDIQIFVLQLFFNFLWSFLFFFMHSPLLAFINILILIVLVFITILKFKKINRVASLILVPYLLWISFASILNLAIVLLN